MPIVLHLDCLFVRFSIDLCSFMRLHQISKRGLLDGCVSHESQSFSLVCWTILNLGSLLLNVSSLLLKLDWKHWLRLKFVNACAKRRISYLVFEGMDLSHKLGVLCSLLLSCKLWCRLMLATITSKPREQRGITYLNNCWHSEFRESNRQSVTSIIFYQATIHLSQNFLLYWCSRLVIHPWSIVGILSLSYLVNLSVQILFGCLDYHCPIQWWHRPWLRLILDFSQAKELKQIWCKRNIRLGMTS